MWFRALFRSCWGEEEDETAAATMLFTSSSGADENEALIYSGAANAAVPYLPDEVLLHILEFAAPAPNERWKWLSRISATRPRLYRITKQLAPTEFSLQDAFVPDKDKATYPDKISWSNRFRFLESFRVAPWKTSRIATIKISDAALSRMQPDETRYSVETYVCKVLRWLVYTKDMFPCVQEVYIHTERGMDQYFGGGELALPLAHLARNLPHLTKLTLVDKSDWTSNQLNVFGRVLQPPMHTLCLVGALGLTAEKMGTFLRFHGPHLRVLEIVDCCPLNHDNYENNSNEPENEGPLWAQLLLVVAKHCRHLEKFSVTSASIGDQELVTVLQSNPSIVDLNISHCNGLDSNIIVRALVEDVPKLQSFRGNSCQWLDDDFLNKLVVSEFDLSLSRRTSALLRTIGISKTRVTVQGLRQVLNQTPTLGRGEGTIEVSLIPKELIVGLRRDDLLRAGCLDQIQGGSTRAEWYSLARDFPDVNFSVPSRGL